VIEVTFYSEGSRLTGFTVQGHSGLADPGEDVLCAAVTSAVRLAECATVNDVAGAGGRRQGEGKGRVHLSQAPGGLGQTNESTCQTLLTALMVYCVQLHEEYPENIIVLDMEV
jgi:uncharacterized protein YsxB (DUF464 family)